MSSDSTTQHHQLPQHSSPSKQGSEAMILRVVAAQEGSVEELEQCKTPTSSSNKIPMIETCPPAPRKRRRQQMQHFSSNIKRSSSNGFNYAVRHDQEVESFFDSTFELARVHKRCRSV
ncbi:hypothetical protein DEO72_LG3g2648 [Vigna unguiculata]|uniref:Uncharacterized protein n=1 Tax=Vigna unguiculata TaxID=3917 RepID=A0A4D6LHW4_VIGUN|nr:hypothetical protein DEO72_LG3g2648 [Vigna unguiculata]